MSSPTASFESRSRRATRRGRSAAELRLTSDSEIDEYADALAAELKTQLKSRGAHGLIEVPMPGELVRQGMGEVDAGSESQRFAIADGALVDVVGPSWTTRKLRSELGGVSAQAVNQRRSRGSLLGLTTSDGAVVYPIFQFVRLNGQLKVKRGLARMFKILKDQDDWHVAVLVNTPSPELGGRTPVEWEREHGDSKELQKLADDIRREAQHR